MQQLKAQIDKGKEHIDASIQETVDEGARAGARPTTRRRCGARRT